MYGASAPVSVLNWYTRNSFATVGSTAHPKLFPPRSKQFALSTDIVSPTLKVILRTIFSMFEKSFASTNGMVEIKINGIIKNKESSLGFTKLFFYYSLPLNFHLIELYVVSYC